MTNYLLVKGDNIIRGDYLDELATLAGFKLKGRTITIGGREYHSFGPDWDDHEMFSQAAKDAVQILQKNHGWTLYSRVI